MKKLTILVALILCVTIGGVYATWIYPGTEVANQQDPITNKMAEVDFEGSAGVYHIPTNNMTILIDQDTAAADPYTAKLVYTGSATIIFTPDENISDAAKAAALNGKITVTATGLAAATYQTNPIWNLDTTFAIQLNEGMWVDNGTSYTYTLNCADLASAITLANTFVLPTHDDYVEFQNLQKEASFRAVIAPGVIVTP